MFGLPIGALPAIPKTEGNELQAGRKPKTRKKFGGRWVPSLRVQEMRREAVQPDDSRQIRRRKEFRAEFQEISARYGGEPRKIRRALARAIVKRDRSQAQQKTLSEVA